MRSFFYGAFLIYLLYYYSFFRKKGLSEDSAGDNHLLYLVGAFVDLSDLSIAHVTSNRIFFAVAIAAEDLDSFAFLRTNIEIIDRFFSEDEVQEIWLTFSDPQMKNAHKRLTSTFFMDRYRHFLVDGGVIHLKTDSNFLFTYTSYMVEKNHLPLLFHTQDLYHSPLSEVDSKLLTIQTYYESMWMERGLNIKYMKFQLPKEGQLTEPEVDIPLDDYRSYHRPKRSGLSTSR